MTSLLAPDSPVDNPSSPGPRTAPAAVERFRPQARRRLARADVLAFVGDAASGAKTAQAAMDSLCAEQEKVLERLERAGVMGDMGPKLAEEHDLEYWNKDAVSKGNLAPQLKIENEKEKPLTVNYDELVKSWQK